MEPMLCIMSIKALAPCATGVLGGAAALSACNAMARAKVKIAIHLSIYGIRRDSTFQVIDVVPARSLSVPGFPRLCVESERSLIPSRRAMLRSGRKRHSCLFDQLSKRVAENARRVARRELRGHRSRHRHIWLRTQPAYWRNGRGQVHPS